MQKYTDPHTVYACITKTNSPYSPHRMTCMCTQQWKRWNGAMGSEIAAHSHRRLNLCLYIWATASMLSSLQHERKEREIRVLERQTEREKERERSDTCTWPEGSRGRRYKAVAGRSYKREAAEQWGYGRAGQAGSGEMREGRDGGMVEGERSKGEKIKHVFKNPNSEFFIFPEVQRTQLQIDKK